MDQVKNIDANKEIAHHKQFLLLTQGFHKLSAVEPSVSVYKLVKVKQCMVNFYPFSHRRLLVPLQHTTFENIVTKGEIAQNELFSLIIPSFLEIFYICYWMSSKSSTVYCLCGKRLSSQGCIALVSHNR